jgi:hypothetical protein
VDGTGTFFEEEGGTYDGVVEGSGRELPPPE